MMYSLDRGAPRVPILLLLTILITLVASLGQQVTASSGNDNDLTKFYKKVNETVGDKEIRVKLRYFLENFPIINEHSGSHKPKNRFIGGIAATVAGIGTGVKLITDIVGAAQGQPNPDKGVCQEACSCVDPDRCSSPECPPLPDDGSCAAYPVCHPVCHLQLIQTARPQLESPTTSAPATTTTTTTTTTSAPTTTTSTKAPNSDKAASNPRDEMKTADFCRMAHEEMKWQIREDAWNCAKITYEMYEKPKFTKIITKEKAKYRYVGEYYLHRAINNSKLNKTQQEEALRVLTSVDVSKLDDKMLETIRDTLDYFGDHELRLPAKTRSTKHRQSESIGSAIAGGVASGIAGSATSAIFGHLINGMEKQNTRIVCACPHVFCPPLNLSNCQGSCPNRAGCYIGQCQCYVNTIPQQILPAPLMKY